MLTKPSDLYKTAFPLLFVFWMNTLHASYQLQVITTHQAAENYITQLQALFPPPVLISAHQHQLLIKATPDIIQEVKYLLQRIDKPIQTLAISIRERVQPNTHGQAKINITHTLPAQQKAFMSTSKTIRSGEKVVQQYQLNLLENHWGTLYLPQKQQTTRSKTGVIQHTPSQTLVVGKNPVVEPQGISFEVKAHTTRADNYQLEIVQRLHYPGEAEQKTQTRIEVPQSQWYEFMHMSPMHDYNMHRYEIRIDKVENINESVRK